MFMRRFLWIVVCGLYMFYCRVLFRGYLIELGIYKNVPLMFRVDSDYFFGVVLGFGLYNDKLRVISFR